MNAFAGFFVSDPRRHDGVRPVQIWGLRLFYLLMLVFVVPEAWGALLRHEGPWDHLRAVAFCVWATYPALALFGLARPLRWLPLMIFTIGYKALWLAFVAWPLWHAGMLAGSKAEEMAYAFAIIPLLAAVVPWGYVWREYVALPRRPAAG
ncbi:hypothetical protein [Tahibacter caeni]|uniref:hypothetical protein n=1 Tax=Tahibacter caeni TaxID=1453545 RepID=UPI002147A1DC|nr:hypothetical protein [Tahibacter caeni]